MMHSVSHSTKRLSLDQTLMWPLAASQAMTATAVHTHPSRPCFHSALPRPARSGKKLIFRAAQQNADCHRESPAAGESCNGSGAALQQLISSMPETAAATSQPAAECSMQPCSLEDSSAEGSSPSPAASTQPQDLQGSAATVPTRMPRQSSSGERHSALHKPVGLVVSSATILGAAVQLSGVAMAPVWLPVIAGGALGGLYAALNRVGMKRVWRSPNAPLNVVITGGAKGIGKALAREFLRCGDRVYITSRSMRGVQQAVAELREEVGPGVQVFGIDCDVSSAQSVERLAQAAQARLGTIDCWVNNAGYSGSFQNFLEASPSQLEQVVRTNLVGTLLCTRAALKLMQGQPGGGHVFNFDGAGADGMATPQYAAYGATKAGIAQLHRSLQHETAGLDGPVAVHNLSPGMVLTDLLLEGATLDNKKIFNILCEQPETVAAFLVPRARTVVARGQQGQYIRYLTLGRALLRFIAAPTRASRFFDAQGAPTYLPERERILGRKARVDTERLAARAARRSAGLGLAYSLSIACTYLLIVADSLQKLQQG